MLLNLREASGPLYRRVYHALTAMLRAARPPRAPALDAGAGPASRRVQDHGDARLRAARRRGPSGEPPPRDHVGGGGRGAVPRRVGAVAAEARGGATALRLRAPARQGS